MITVVLTTSEWTAASSIGQKREDLRKSRGVIQQFEKLDAGGTTDERNQIGAIAEYALAKHYGPDVLRDWCENKAFSLEHWTIKADVGANLHVRATSNPRARFLVIHEAPRQKMIPEDRRRNRPTDPPTGIFIFAYVDVATRTITFRGWRLADDVQTLGYWNDSGPGFRNQDRHAFTIPVSDLSEMDDIPQEAIRCVT